MRKTKFRGLRIDNGKWVVGDLIQQGETDAFIIVAITVIGDFMQVYGNSVVPESVAQFTGLCDKNGREIYEGDILQHESQKQSINTMKWNKHEASFTKFLPLRKFEIIGNIYENPELLEVNNNA